MTKIERELNRCIADPEYFRKEYYLLANPEDAGDPADRIRAFRTDVAWTLSDNVDGQFADNDVAEFYAHWTQFIKRSPLMKFEKEDTFSIKGRFATWMANKKKYATVNLLRKTGFAIR